MKELIKSTCAGIGAFLVAVAIGLFCVGCELEKTHTGDTYIFTADDKSSQVNQLYNDDGNNAQAANDDTSNTSSNAVSVVTP